MYDPLRGSSQLFSFLLFSRLPGESEAEDLGRATREKVDRFSDAYLRNCVAAITEER